jgi:hypothetical protein
MQVSQGLKIRGAALSFPGVATYVRAKGLPLVGLVSSDGRFRCAISLFSFLAFISGVFGLLLLMVKSPAHFGVVMNAGGRQLMLSLRTKISRHRFDAEKIGRKKEREL